MKKLIIVFGDQLSESLSSLKSINKNDDVLLFETHEEFTKPKHHQKKIAFLISARRHFAEFIQSKANLLYVKLDDKDNTQTFEGEIKRWSEKKSYDKIVLTEPSEYWILSLVQNLAKILPIEILEDDRFLCSHEEFQKHAEAKKQLRMEFFYEEMRKKHQILMNNGKPEGGSWNFDKENRKSPPKDLIIPKPYSTTTDTIMQEAIALVKTHYSDHFGHLDPFHYAVTRKEALKALKHFINERLPQFGDYQDAMLENNPWMFHSHISFYINTGLLLPLECIHKAEKAYHDKKAPLNAVEGFIRQILGWREYVRGVYWLKMPNYEKENHLSATQPLPSFFWDANTKMNCLKQCIEETQANAYAHHIQRLMVLGNFLLLIGADPKAVNEWYWIVYADAFQWVELPNVSGMILYADGGHLASKPYAASGNYINKMSDYCKNCHYKVKEKKGPTACPFNYLYWNFLLKNQSLLQKNPRLNMPYANLAKKKTDDKKEIVNDAKRFISDLHD